VIVLLGGSLVTVVSLKNLASLARQPAQRLIIRQAQGLTDLIAIGSQLRQHDTMNQLEKIALDVLLAEAELTLHQAAEMTGIKNKAELVRGSDGTLSFPTLR
jgi:hypothetical protein